MEVRAAAIDAPEIERGINELATAATVSMTGAVIFVQFDYQLLGLLIVYALFASRAIGNIAIGAYRRCRSKRASFIRAEACDLRSDAALLQASARTIVLGSTSMSVIAAGFFWLIGKPIVFTILTWTGCMFIAGAFWVVGRCVSENRISIWKAAT